MTRISQTYEALLQYARQDVRERHIDRGEAVARQALSLVPKRGAAYNVLAVIRHLKGDDAEAQKLLHAAVELEPTYRPAQENLERLARLQRDAQLRFEDELEGEGR